MLVTELGSSLIVCPACGDESRADCAHDALALYESHEYLTHVVLPALEPRRAR